jgi:hypothetical protein
MERAKTKVERANTKVERAKIKNKNDNKQFSSDDVFCNSYRSLKVACKQELDYYIHDVLCACSYSDIKLHKFKFTVAYPKPYLANGCQR